MLGFLPLSALLGGLLGGAGLSTALFLIATGDLRLRLLLATGSYRRPASKEIEEFQFVKDYFKMKNLVFQSFFSFAIDLFCGTPVEF